MPEERAAPGYETRDVTPRFMAQVAGGILLLTAVCLIAVWFVGHYVWRETRDPEALGFTGPKVRQTRSGEPQTAGEELQRLRLQNLKRLSTFRWIDRESGIGRIPIDEAMGVIARRHQRPQEKENSNRDKEASM